MKREFSQWTNAYQDQVWSLARYLLADREEAEDVTQEAFLRLWQQREAMVETRVRPWLLRVVRNLCLDRLRRSGRECPAREADAPLAPGPLEGLQRARLGGVLQAAVAGLAEPFRSLIVLRDIQQLSYAEVAGVTGLSLPQVKTYLHRARRQLRDVLQDSREEVSDATG
jgi:RNA polymerase sigma-70 factor, ECF subfamily